MWKTRGKKRRFRVWKQLSRGPRIKLSSGTWPPWYLASFLEAKEEIRGME